MIKNWNQFLLLESNNEKPKGFEKFDNKKPYSNTFGLKPNEIEDLFYVITDQKLFLSISDYQYLDNDGVFRNQIKIGEELKPSIRITIRTTSSSTGNDKSLISIKNTLKKIISINKLKSGYNFNDIYVLDPNKLDDLEDDNIINPIDNKIDIDDPFSIISIKNNNIIYTYDEDDFRISSSLDIVLISDKKITITPKLWYEFYNLTGCDMIDEKGNLWFIYRFKDIAEFLFEGKYVETYFEPEDWENIYEGNYDYNTKDIIDSISYENKKKLLTYLYDDNGLDDLNSELDTNFETLEEFLEIDDDQLETIFNNGSYDILNDITWRYTDVMSDMYYKEASEYIKDETTKYLQKYVECKYIDVYNSEEHYDELWLCFDPEVFIYEYSESNSDNPEDWGDWSDIVGEDLETIIDQGLDEHSNQISWSNYIGDGIWLSSNDINNYIKDIFGDYKIK